MMARIALFLTALAILFSASAHAAGAERVITYSIAYRGDVAGDASAFDSAIAAAYGDPRGWSLSGAVSFRRVPAGGDLVLWLASPGSMTSFSAGCSPQWSCRVGRDVVINDLRFHTGSPYWGGDIDRYRILLINHETGHWIGFDHATCPGAGDDAPVMMQQSKGVGDCVGNPWPLPGERREAALMLGIDPAVVAGDVDPPQGQGFIAVP